MPASGNAGNRMRPFRPAHSILSFARLLLRGDKNVRVARCYRRRRKGANKAPGQLAAAAALRPERACPVDMVICLDTIGSHTGRGRREQQPPCQPGSRARVGRAKAAANCCASVRAANRRKVRVTRPRTRAAALCALGEKHGRWCQGRPPKSKPKCSLAQPNGASARTAHVAAKGAPRQSCRLARLMLEDCITDWYLRGPLSAGRVPELPQRLDCPAPAARLSACALRPGVCPGLERVGRGSAGGDPSPSRGCTSGAELVTLQPTETECTERKLAGARATVASSAWRASGKACRAARLGL